VTRYPDATSDEKIFPGNNPIRSCAAKVGAERVVLDDEGFYRIANRGRLRPFVVSVVSRAALRRPGFRKGALAFTDCGDGLSLDEMSRRAICKRAAVVKSFGCGLNAIRNTG